LRGIRFDGDTSARAREQAESAIIVRLAGPEAQRTHSPRSWRFRHGAADFKQAVDLASRFNGSDEAVRAYLDPVMKSPCCGRRSKRSPRRWSPSGL
jgi:hypothetical protein